MLKLIKKSLVMLVALSMLLGTLSVPAFAEGEVVAPAETTLLAPPAGTYSSLSFGLNDSEGTALENTALSISSGVSGVYKNGSNVILDGDEITAGTFDLTATDGSATATQTMTVNELLYYEDFEDTEVGANANTTRLNKLDGTISTSSITTAANTVVVANDGAKNYAKPSTTSEILPIDLSSFAAGCKRIVIEATVKRGTSSYPITIKTTGTGNLELKYWSSNAAYWKHTAGNVELGHKMAKDDSWEKIKIELDLVNGKVKTFMGGSWRPEFSNDTWKNATPVSISFGLDIDDIAIYSGSAYTLPANTISGDSNIFAPKSGEYRKHDAYKVADSTGAEIANASISISNDLNGSLKVINGALAVSGEKALGGTTTLIAKNASGDFLAKKRVNVLAEQYSEDFEDATEDSTVTTARLTKLNGTASDLSIASTSSTATIANEDGRGNYADCVNTMDTPTMSVDLATLAADSDNIVIAAKIRPDATTAGRIWMGKTGDTSITNHIFAIRSRSAGKAGMYSYFDKAGVYNSANASTNLATNKNDGNWVDFRVEIDFSANTYSLYIAEQCAMDNWKMPCTPDADRRTVHFGMDVDDITVYSGEELFLETETERVSIPASGDYTYPVSATYNDGTALINLQVISDELSAEGNVITVIPSDEVKPYIVTLSDGFVKTDVKLHTDKDFITVNGNEYVEGTPVENGDNTISAYYGASDLPSGRNIVVAQYGTDSNGNKYLKDVKTNESANSKELIATLEATVADGDIIKVFVWIWNTLVPIKLTNIG